MKKLLSGMIIGIGLLATWLTIYTAGTATDWKFDGLRLYAWLPVLTVIGVTVAGLYALHRKHRAHLLKIIELIVYTHIAVLVVELWQNSASFPPISTRQYIVEISKLALMMGATFVIALALRNKLIAHVKI